MKANKKYILGICGSLRVNSSAASVLRFAGSLFPDFVQFSTYQNLSLIPPFDDSQYVPEEVANFLTQISKADGIIICSPEYAFGVPGTLKNALDWTVSSVVFDKKPIALITAATGGDKAHASLLMTLSALSAKVDPSTSLLLSFIKSKIDASGNIKDLKAAEEIKCVTESLTAAIH